MLRYFVTLDVMAVVSQTVEVVAEDEVSAKSEAMAKALTPPPTIGLWYCR